MRTYIFLSELFQHLSLWFGDFSRDKVLRDREKYQLKRGCEIYIFIQVLEFEKCLISQTDSDEFIWTGVLRKILRSDIKQHHD